MCELFVGESTNSALSSSALTVQPPIFLQPLFGLRQNSSLETFVITQNRVHNRLPNKLVQSIVIY